MGHSARFTTKQPCPLQQTAARGEWYAAGTQCNACYMAESRERKRKAQQAEQKGKQTIQQAFAAAAAKKLKQQ